MTARMTARHPWSAAVKCELEKWPGVRAAYEHRGKHAALVLRFGELERRVFHPETPSDGAHGLQNHIADVKGVLRGMGAKRLRGRAKLPRAPKRKRVRVVRVVAPPVPAPTALSRDPWAALVGWAQRVFGGSANA